jgi:hypothetical protein
MIMRRNLRPLVLLGAAVLLLPGAVAAAGNGAGGVTGPAFYVDGTLYRTVGTPTDLGRSGAPAHSYDTIYDFGGLQANVATAAPGDRDYNGGRWMVHALTFDDYAAAVDHVDLNDSGDIDSDAEVQLALAGSHATDAGIVRQFVCPVIKVPRAR